MGREGGGGEEGFEVGEGGVAGGGFRWEVGGGGGVGREAGRMGEDSGVGEGGVGGGDFRWEVGGRGVGERVGEVCGTNGGLCFDSGWLAGVRIVTKSSPGSLQSREIDESIEASTIAEGWMLNWRSLPQVCFLHGHDRKAATIVLKACTRRIGTPKRSFCGL